MDIFTKNKKENIEEEKETLHLVEYKENIFKKILNSIKKFFHC